MIFTQSLNFSLSWTFPIHSYDSLLIFKFVILLSPEKKYFDSFCKYDCKNKRFNVVF